jgi:leucyl/phenylalanyl-tRNA--protein transferase
MVFRMTSSSAPDSGIRFPPLEHATPEGLLAVGGDLSVPRLLTAYRAGIFPWYSAGQPILWWSPDPRTVLFPEYLSISRSLRKTIRSHVFRVTLDTAFDAVMDGCAAPRPGQLHGSTWITTEMRAAYLRLFAAGHAHSVEAWRGDVLAGGLYGVAIGGAFFGESMFTRETGASKVAFVRLVRQLQVWGYTLVDCQVYSNHLASLGATEIPRSEFVARLKTAIALPPHPAPWRFDDGLGDSP